MSNPSSLHSYKLYTTQYITQKQTTDHTSINIQLLQSTCLLSEQLNHNNLISDNNLIYIAGNFIVFNNFFQNSKIFATLVTPHKIVGMAANHIGKPTITIVSQPQDHSQLLISLYSLSHPQVPTHSLHKPLIFIDIILLNSTQIILACIDKQTNIHQIYIIKQKNVNVIEFPTAIKRLLCQDKKIFALFKTGGLYLLETQKPHINPADIKPIYPQTIIQDYCQIDNQIKIILFSNNIISCHFLQLQQQFTFNLTPFLPPNTKTHRIAKLSRNILIAHQSSLTLSHLILKQSSLQFITNYTYPQKLKSKILSLQTSPDQMYLLLSVQLLQKSHQKIQNFLFNLTTLNKNHQFILPYTRILPLPNDFYHFNSMQNTLASTSYLLFGTKIFTLTTSPNFQHKTIYNLYELPKFFTIHPLGYQLLCAYDNVIKFYNKLQKQLQQVWLEQYICTAAKYSISGTLVLSCIQDSFTTLIIYDPYKFVRIKNIPISYLKLQITKIQWINSNILTLYSTITYQLLKINIFTGQKLSQYKQPKQKQKKFIYTPKSIHYDLYYDKIFIGTNVNMIITVNKQQSTNYILNQFKYIYFPQQITTIKINHSLNTIFFGSNNGTFYWCTYPLKLRPPHIDQPAGIYHIIQQLSKIKLHTSPITSIDFTTNNKFMMLNLKSQGYFKCKIKKITPKNTPLNNTINMNIVFQQLGNLVLNTLDTSSTTQYTSNKQKLKLVLQKRKQCFNDLQQFRKQWQLKLLTKQKKLNKLSKQNQLSFIKNTLNQLNSINSQKIYIKNNIDNLQLSLNTLKKNKQQTYHQSILSIYEQKAQLTSILQTNIQSHTTQYNQLTHQCTTNLQQISTDLSTKYQTFYSNYHQMLTNLTKFYNRYTFQLQQQHQQYQLQIQQYLHTLSLKQLQLTNLANDLSIKITQAKKHHQRYTTRLSFLQHKQLFFLQQHQNTLQQKYNLLSLKTHLQSQLQQLQKTTCLKQSQLTSFRKVNQLLEKFKQLHQNLSNNTQQQIIYIHNQSHKLHQNTISIHQQLQSLTTTNQHLTQKLATLQHQLAKQKTHNSHINLKTKNITHYLTQIISQIQNITSNSSPQQKQQHLKNIYNKYYTTKTISTILQQSPNQSSPTLTNQNQLLNTQQLKYQTKSKIYSELQAQKTYLQNNIQIINDFYTKNYLEINLNYQSVLLENFKLITECHLRKSSIIHQKKIISELLSNIQKYSHDFSPNAIKQNTINQFSTSQTNKQPISSHRKNEIPFIIYQKQKHQKPLSRIKSSDQPLTSPPIFAPLFSHSPLRHTQKIFTQKKPNFSLKKPLDFKPSPRTQLSHRTLIRRIQTAQTPSLKKPPFQLPQYFQPPHHLHKPHQLTKPLTATNPSIKNRSTLQSALTNKNKSISKPSTCANTTYIKTKSYLPI